VKNILLGLIILVLICVGLSYGFRLYRTLSSIDKAPKIYSKPLSCGDRTTYKAYDANRDVFYDKAILDHYASQVDREYVRIRCKMTDEEFMEAVKNNERRKEQMKQVQDADPNMVYPDMGQRMNGRRPMSK